MNYSKIQKFIASILIPFFLFGLVFRFPINLYNISQAGDEKLYSLVSILVNEEIYDDVENSLETYAEDISKQLKNTKVVIIPTPKNSKPFNIASLNENLYYEGYKGLKQNINFKSRLVGTLLVGNFKLPVVSAGGKSLKTILPYVDFENKAYIFDHKTKKYIKNPNNINSEKAEIWHGVINPNTGNIETDIQKINDFFEKDHNFYEGKGNFKKENGIINGKINEENSGEYKPYVFYFDQFREQKSFIYSKYKGYQAYLQNKEDIIYKRYSKDLAEKIENETTSGSTETFNDLLSKVDSNYKKDTIGKGPDLTNVSDISTKYITDKTAKKFLETINSSKIGDFRKNVYNAGRYNENSKKINVDLIPYLISSLDDINDKLILGFNNKLEKRINDLVINEGLSRKIAIPTSLIYKRDSLNCNKTYYENILYGKLAKDIKTAKECSIYLGTNSNNGQLVEANRGLNIENISDDLKLCKYGNTQGYWGGNSPINLNKDLSLNGKFELSEHDLTLGIKPLFDIKGSKKIKDNNKTPSPLDCLKNNYFVSSEEENDWGGGLGCYTRYQIPINGQEAINWNCSTKNKKYSSDESFEKLYKYINSGECNNNSTEKKLFLDGKEITSTTSIKNNLLLNIGGLGCINNSTKTKTFYYKTIPSYIKHISPTIEELNIQSKSKITQNLGIDKNRYIDFISANGNLEKINYPYLFRLKNNLSNIDSFDGKIKKISINLDKFLDEKTNEIKEKIKNNDPSSLKELDLEIYEKYLKNGEYPDLEKFDLKKFIKNLPKTKINIAGEEKEISYYDSLVFALFWNNLSDVSQKYKFIFENYLIDQTNSEYSYLLPKNKKIYDIAYLGAPGDHKSMYVGIDPEDKGVNPYSELDSQNGLLDAEIFDHNFRTDNSDNNSDSIFKCAPPEGVNLAKWPKAISCRIKNLFPVEIDFSSSKCSSETLFLDDLKNKNSHKRSPDEIKECRKDLNQNLIEDCVEKELENAEISIISSSKKAHINSYVGLEARITDKHGKTLYNVNNLKTTFELVKIESVDKNKKIETVYDANHLNEISEKNKNLFIDYNPLNIYTKNGIAKYSLTSKNKESNYYFKAISILEGKDKEIIKKIESNIIKIEIREDLFTSTLTKNTNGKSINGADNIFASDKKNIFLIDFNNTTAEKNLEQIHIASQAKEKLVISLAHYSKGNKKIPLNYPLTLSLTKNGKKIVEDINITKENLSKFYPVFSLSKSGNYKLKITNKFGETTSKTFTILPEIANKIDLNLSTNILEKNGNITSNVFVLKDKYGNVSNGFNYKIQLESEGNFSFPINRSEFLSKKEINIFRGYKGFQIKPGNKNSVGKLNLKVLYKDKIITSVSKTIQTIEKINIDFKKPEKILVGGNKYDFEINFKDNQGNLLKNLNTRVYFSIDKIYGITEKPYFEVKNGKAIIKFKTNNLAGKEIPIDIQLEGMRKISKKFITIYPEKAIKLDLKLSKNKVRATTKEEIILSVSLKDKFNNTVFTDNSTKLKINIKDDYNKIVKLANSTFKIAKNGKANFKLKATPTPGTAYFKVSSFPDLSNNSFEIKRKNKNGELETIKISGVGEKSIKIKTYYFWDKNTFKDKKYNSLYTVMLGSNYGDITQKDYLASSILFEKNNRNLAVTTLLNNPYDFNDVININPNGKIKNNSGKKDLTQDIKLAFQINNKRKLFANIYNNALNKQIGKIYYRFFDTTELGICETTIPECNINKNKNSIFLKNINSDYNVYRKGSNIFLEKGGNNILEINKNGEFITNKLLKFEIDSNNFTNLLVLNITSDDGIIGQIVINNSRSIIKLDNSSYSVHKNYINGELNTSIYYNNTFEKNDKVNSFSKSKIDNLENFKNKESIGWKGENKFLLDFVAGKNVGEAVLQKQSFGTINLGDPVISLKPIKSKFKNGDEKSFNATIGKKISQDNDIFGYKIFDYDNDGLDDILLIKTDGFFKLLENKINSKEFLDKGNLAYIVDHGNKNFIEAGDFTGDGFDDIFFINNKGIPSILNNNNKDFKRITLEEQFKLNGKIVQVEGFDMDNDGKIDIITLDDSGEINIFYGGGDKNNPKFTKKFIGKGYGIKLNSNPKNTGAFIYYEGLYQIPKPYKKQEGIVDEQFLNNQIFVEIPVGTKKLKDSGLELYNLPVDVIRTGSGNLTEFKTFIKSEYSDSAGIEVKKVFKDINGDTLQSGDIVKVEITIKNISNSVKKDISFVDNIQKPFLQTKEKIITEKGEIKNGPSGYDILINNFSLSPGETNKITYTLKTPNFSFGNIKVGLFEKGEIGDDLFGDIIVKKDNQNCSETVDFFRSENSRIYSGLIKKAPTCDAEKNKLPENLARNTKDEDKNGVPDYIDDITKNPKEYAITENNNQENSDNLKDIFLDNLDKINEKVDEYSDDLDNLIEGFSCGFGGGSCIATPLNRAPLAPGNDPILFGSRIGDGLKVGEGVPIFSSLTGIQTHCGHSPCCIPSVWPASSLAYVPGPKCGSPSAGGIYGTSSPTNTFRLFTTPTLTGGFGTAACFGGPANVVGNSNPQGVHPLIPGGNCIVTAKPLNSCSNDGSEGDPESMGESDNFGNGDNGFGVINGNCSNSNKNINKTLDKDFINKYYNNLNSGLGYPTTFTTEYKNALKGYNSSSNNGFIDKPILSFNGNGVGEQSLSVDVNVSNALNGNFEDVIKIKKDRVSPFPSFLMDWMTRQIEEIVTKFTDLPTLFLILPDFSGLIDTDWIEYGKKAKKEGEKIIKKENEKNKPIEEKINNLIENKTNLDCNGKDNIECNNIDLKIKILELQKIGNKTSANVSGIKTAYEFLGNIPIVNIVPQQVNVNIPWIDENSLNKFLVDAKATKEQWENELNLSKIKGGVNSDLKNLIENLDQNIAIVEEYKNYPRKLTKLLNQKEIRINQVMCNVESVSEITSGWIGRNGKRFKAWVETYILIKSILKSWQLLVDVFNDYDSECHECKNERSDLLNYEFKVIDMILPKFPIIQLPKWPDLILDIHNIRADITVKIPDIHITKRMIVLPNLPKLTLPNANGNINIDFPNMPILPRFPLPELPDLPSFPTVKLPDLPPPPKLPKLFSELEGVLNILKLITKAMCLLKQLPFVPEWRAGDQIAFLTERNGYLSTDFTNKSTPKFTLPYVDAIKITTFVNLEEDNSFLVEILKNAVKPLNSKSNNLLKKFNKSLLDDMDYFNFSDKSINENKTYDVKENKILFNKNIPKNIKNLYSYIDKNKEKTINSEEFLNNINKSIASESFTKDPRTDKIKKLWKDVSNYSFYKENKLIKDLEKNNYEKFENINKILENELRKNLILKKEIKKSLKENNNLFLKINAKEQNNDFIEYKKSLLKYNNKFLISAKNLIEGKSESENSKIKKDGKNLLNRVKGGLKEFKNSRKNSKILALNTDNSTNTINKNSCNNNGNYGYIYKGLYIIEKNKSYRLFNYLDELKGDETYSSIDYDKDGDEDLLYFVNGDLYLKENLSIIKNQENNPETPLKLNISENKYFNGSRFIEAINGFKEINTDSKFLNLSFDAPTDNSIKHFRVEYYSIVDKHLRKDKYDGIKKHIIDAFITDKTQEYTDNLEKKHKSYINYIGDIPAINLSTVEMINIGESLNNENRVNLSASTPIYTGNSSATISYYLGNDKQKIPLSKDIEKNSSIKFKQKIVITGINGEVYSKGKKQINLVGNDIKKYIGLPLFEGSELSIIPDLKSKMPPDLANIEIKYNSNESKSINFYDVSSYKYYDLGKIKNKYLIRLSSPNDYFYGKIYGIKDNILGTNSAQKLFSPQKEADTIAPELDLNALGKIRIPVYQEKTIDLRNVIYENSGFTGIKNLKIKLKENTKILPDNYEIEQNNYSIKLKFHKFTKLFKEKIDFILEDTNGNKSISSVDFEVYSPKPKITNNYGNQINGKINENLFSEPINLYRVRSGVIKRLETKDNKIKVYTVDEGSFNFNVKGETSSGLILKENNVKIAEINEETGNIKILNNTFNIKVKSNDSLYPEIIIEDFAGNKIYSQFLKFEKNIGINNVEIFDNLSQNGIYLKLNNSNYDSYNIPNGAKYSAGVSVIFNKSDADKTAIFTIFPDGRIKYNLQKYTLEYSNSGENIVIKLKSRIGNKIIGELLYKIKGTYLMK